jgi:putative hydrolase of the HAD superfamily
MAKTVVFDLGGVMVRINRTWQDAARTAGVNIGLPPTPPVGLGDLTIFNHWQAARTGPQDYYDALAEALSISHDEARRVHDCILMEPYPGTEALVHELHSLGFHTGCLSNTNAPHFDLMTSPAHYPNIAALQTKIASHEVGLDKPGEEIFRCFEQAADARPEDIVFFDDVPENAEAACRCGWQGFAIDPFGNTASQMRSHLVELGWLNAESVQPQCPD